MKIRSLCCLLFLALIILVGGSFKSVNADTVTTLVDFGATSTSNTFGLSGWNTVIKDQYTDYQALGPGGMTIVNGSNYYYNFQGVTGSSRNFVAGEKIVVTWYNNSGATVGFTPNISFNDPDRIGEGAVGTWYSMTAVSIPANSSATSEYVVTSGSAGSYALVNTNVNYTNNKIVIADKITLTTPGGTSPTPPPGDTTSPIISGISSLNISQTGATISWNTDENSDTQIDYGATTGYGSQTSINSSLTTSHSQSISGLLAGTLYNYRVRSRDASGNLAISANNTFTTSSASTPPPPPPTPTPSTGGTAVANLANSMQAGTWATLTTNSLTSVVGPTPLGPGSSGHIFAEGPDLQYDPITKALYFHGSDHCDTNKFIKYSFSTNTWTQLPYGPWMPTTSDYCNGMMHGEDNAAIDKANGVYWTRPWGTRSLQKYVTSTGAWTTTTEWASPVAQTMVGMDFFPDRNSVFIVDAAGGGTTYPAVREYNVNSNTWSADRLVTSFAGSNPYSDCIGSDCLRNFALYNPVHHVMLFTIEGFHDKRLFKMDASGVFTQLKNAPVGVGIMCPCVDDAALFRVDPVTGDYIVISQDGNDKEVHFWRYDIVTDVWQTLINNIPSGFYTNFIYSTFGIAATTIDDLGVIMYASCNINATSCRTHLYKHAAGTGTLPPPPPPNFDFSLTNGGNKTVTAGSSVTNSISASLVSGTSQAVSFSSSGLPSGAAASFSGTSCSPSCFSTMTITTTGATPAGTYSVIVTGSGGVTKTTSFTLTVSGAVTPPPPPPTGGTAFTQKCTGDGVLNCFDFDNASILHYTWPTGTPCDAAFAGKPNESFGLDRRTLGNATGVVQNGQCVYPVIDTNIKNSGNGSLKFTIPSNSSANSSGLFSEPFKRYADGTFPYIAPGSPLGNVVYIQFYQRVDQNFQNTNYLCTGGDCGGWKQSIFYGNPPRGSSSSGIEVTTVNGWQRDVPQMYGQQGHDDYGKEDIAGCTFAKATSGGGSGSGYGSRPNYRDPLNPNCAHYLPDQWMEYTFRIEVNGPPSIYAGCAGGTGAKSRVQEWVNGKLVVDFPCASINFGSADGDGLGQVMLTPYHTNKSAAQAHPIGYTWYDDLIVSTHPIAMVSGSVTPPTPMPTPMPPPPPTPDTTNPIVAFTSPINNNTVSSSAVTILVTASDNIAVSKVSIQIDSTTAVDDFTAPYSAAWNTNLFSNGLHTIKATATDSSGNTATTQITVTVNNVVVTPPPVPTPTPSPSPSPSPTPSPTPSPSPAPSPSPSPSPSPAPGPAPSPNPIPGPAPFPPFTPTPPALAVIPDVNPVGTGDLSLINASGTFYLVNNGRLLGITNPGMLTSYGFTFSDAKIATTQQLALPKGPLLTPGNGSLVKSKEDQTVYLVSNQKRYGFTSAKVFLDLGFKFSSVLVVTNPELQSLPKGDNVNNGQGQHLPGLDINRNGTVYWVGDDGKLHAYPSLSVYNSWHVANDFTRVVLANTADVSLPVGEMIVVRVLK